MSALVVVPVSSLLLLLCFLQRFDGCIVTHQFRGINRSNDCDNTILAHFKSIELNIYSREE